MSQHKDYKFSVTIKTDDLPLVYCLRGLSQHCQATGNARIPWGGMKRGDWERDGHQVTFHFSNLFYRADFLRETERLLPKEMWSTIRQNDNDPATPQTRDDGD